MKFRTLLAGVAVAMSLAACQTAPQNPIALTKENLAAQKGRVGVALRTPPTDLYLPGANCLLCMGAATIANSSLNTYSKTLKTEDLAQVRAEIVDLLKKRGIDAVAIDGQFDFASLADAKLGPNFADKDFAAKYGKDYEHLVVINVQQLGFVRNYAAYIPTSDAQATVQGFGYMVNLKTNAYEWYTHVQVTRSADGAWDEGGSFPGLTNAYFQAIEQAKDRVKAPFAQ